MTSDDGNQQMVFDDGTLIKLLRRGDEKRRRQLTMVTSKQLQ